MPRLMQSTLTEHANSQARDRPCASCHMPLAEGAKHHGFGQVRRATWLRRKLDVHVELTGWQSLSVRLEPVNPAHGFPTGDLFRRLEIGAELVAPSGASLARDVRHLGREFALGPGGARQQTADNRIFNHAVELELDVSCGDEPGNHLRWWVTLQRVAFHDPREPSRSEIESEVVIHRGELCDTQKERQR